MSVNKTKIEWTNYTWNPIVGCKHNCYYCYAKRMNDRFKWIPEWNKPEFFFERLNDKMPNKPSKIFVGSMADIFGFWIPKEWIEKIIEVIRKNPQHTFQFLTKNPEKYLEFEFPRNCWLGTTIEGTAFTEHRIEPFYKIKNYKFVSVEPILGDFSEIDLGVFDLVIIGADSSKGANYPKQQWIKSVNHRNIFFEKNIQLIILNKLN